ncbi:MAG: ABC transporter substrate-binding protein [Thaumarchaeota archaeon]|nr:ABC transporter substrate-binding protein [Nitrososphaerota archaeon]
MKKIRTRSGVSSAVAAVLLIVGLVVGAGVGYGITSGGKVTTTVTGAGVGSTVTVGGGGSTVTIGGTTVTVSGGGGANLGTITIGDMTDLTDGLSSIGIRIKASTEQAAVDINAWIQNTSWAGKVTFKVDSEDYAIDNTKASSILNTWATQGVSVFVGPENSGTAGALLQAVNSNHIVMISPSSTSHALAISNDYLFRLAPTDDIQGKADARMMYNNGVRGLIIVYRQDTYGSGLANYTAANFKADGGQVLAQIPYDTTTTNFGPIVQTMQTDWQSAIKQTGLNSSNVAFQAISFGEFGPLVVSAQQNTPSILNTTQPWYGSDGQEGDTTITNSTHATAVEQVRLPSTVFGYTNSTKTAVLCAEILAATHNSCESYSINAYDGVWLAALSVLACGSNDGQCIQKILPSVAANYYGVSGWTTLNAAGDRAASDYQVWCVVKGTANSGAWNYCGSWTFLTDTFTWLPGQAPAV